MLSCIKWGGRSLLAGLGLLITLSVAPSHATSGWKPITLPLNPNQFTSPKEIAVDAESNVYLYDSELFMAEKRLLRRGANGSWTVIAEEGNEIGQVNSVEDLAVDRAGTLYVAEQYPPRIQKRTPEGVWSNLTLPASYPYSFSAPVCIALDHAGNLYLGAGDDYGAYIAKRDVEGNWSLVADRYAAEYNAPGKVYKPVSMFVDRAGNLYVVEPRRIQKRDASGKWTFLSCLENCTEQSSSTGYKEAVSDGADYVYLLRDHLSASASHLFLEKIDMRTGTSVELASSYGTAALQGGFGKTSIDAEPSGKIYLGSSNGLYRLENELPVRFAVSSPPLSGQVRLPHSITVDDLGNLYVADTANNRVQRRDHQGKWSVIAHPGDSLGRVTSPQVVCLDDEDNLYVRSGSETAPRNQRRDPVGRWTELPKDVFFPCLTPPEPYRWRLVDLGGYSFKRSYQEVTDRKGDNYFFNGYAEEGGGLFRWDSTGKIITIAPKGIKLGQVMDVRNLMFDPQDRLYVLDHFGSNSSRITRLNPDGTWEAVANPGSRIGEIGHVTFMDFDRQGSLYVLDSYWDAGDRHRLQRRNPDGKWEHLPFDHSIFMGGVQDLEIDASGNIYAAASYRNHIYAFSGSSLGDLNADGEITVADVVLALQITASILEPSPEQRSAGDMDGEGSITVRDVVMILRRMIGLPMAPDPG